MRYDAPKKTVSTRAGIPIKVESLFQSSLSSWLGNGRIALRPLTLGCKAVAWRMCDLVMLFAREWLHSAASTNDICCVTVAWHTATACICLVRGWTAGQFSRDHPIGPSDAAVEATGMNLAHPSAAVLIDSCRMPNLAAYACCALRIGRHASRQQVAIHSAW